MVHKVLIVGAGPSGLAALKEMLAAGFHATVVDEQAEFGGVYSPNSNVTFDHLYLTNSNMFMAFSDFPPLDNKIVFWTKAEYFAYLEKYVQRFQLRQYMRLGTTVLKARLNADKTWEVETSSGGNTEINTYTYLIVATGANHVPFVPAFDGFQGEVIHSSQYHSSKQFAGKRVLVVGGGENSSDVASSVADTAKSVTGWTRHFIDPAPRFLTDYLDDPDYDERKALRQQTDRRPRDFLESITTSPIVRNLPLAVWSTALHGLINSMKAAHGPKSTQGVIADLSGSAWSEDYYSSDTSHVAIKSAILATSVARGELDWIVAPTISCEGSTVRFKEPKYLGSDFTDKPSVDREFDAIVACTGFRLDFNWISAPTEVNPNPRTWFKHCFPPGLGENVAFLGFARPHSGGISQCSEMLARYIALLLEPTSGVDLPLDYEQIAKKEGECEEECFHLSPHYRLLVDYYAFMTSVARLIGCTPKTPSITNSTEMVKYWTFPRWPCFFRSQGVGANVAAYNEVLNRFETYDALAPMPLLAIQIIFMFIAPFINFFSFFFGGILNLGSMTSLPSAYKWRMSKFHFLYSNSLELADFKTALTQLATGAILLANFLMGKISKQKTV